MRSLLLAYCTAAVAIAGATFISPPPAQAMTMTTPAGLNVAARESTDKLDVQCGCGGYAYYAPYAYSYGYAPYAYSYYRPYAYGYAYRPYAYGAYAYGGYGPRIWRGWGRRW
ncbi:MAG: hypothetical protein WAN75_09850 [Xanthobacteraceae bacterium]|jgi:hypothetical protein